MSEAVSPSAIQRAILGRAIDYAGLFPPATLSMPQAARNYALYASGEEAWALGRFVVPATRIEEFEAALQEIDLSEAERPVKLAAVSGTNIEADASGIAEFNARNVGRVEVDTVECRTGGVEEIEKLARTFPSISRFAEVALGDQLGELLGAVAATGSAAKIRTGGVIPGAIPETAAVLNFIQGCKAAGVAFKATAGLHHVHRGSYRLTYESDSPSGVMFGFLNVICAAAAAYSQRSPQDVQTLLEADDSSTLAMDERGIEWNGVPLSLAQIETARREFMLGFGSCSFREPMDELSAISARVVTSSGRQ